MVEVKVPRQYGYCILVLGSSWLVNTYLSSEVDKAREKYKAKNPNLFAPTDEDLDNEHEIKCIERQHKNTGEKWPYVSVVMMINGVFNPLPAAVLGGLWYVGRVVVTKRYVTNGLQIHIINQAGDLPFIVLTFYNAYRLVTQ
jgi:glutathione S-transferase